ncbi:MAG: hypothetical protein K2O70_08985 [Desulfovibrionaceae bacterium]|nr:hypothetical protein [Desulfovibrionaceae bacterium]
MTGRWLTANKHIFVRDLVRDYCHVCAALDEQNRRFAQAGTISYAVLRDLLGEAIRKGVFWRLKDTAHHLFRTVSDDVEDAGDGILLWQYSSEKTPDGLVHQNAIDAVLDWCIGYAFHECVKLKEDAFQHQHYANRLVQMSGRVGGYENTLLPLAPLVDQTRESTGRELKRILHVLDHGRALLVRYLQNHGDNRQLARFLVTEKALVRRAFGAQYAGLLEALYGADGERLYLLAAEACLEGGRPERALKILDDAALPPVPGSEAERLRRLAETSGS